jgi:hypothetical protein
MLMMYSWHVMKAPDFTFVWNIIDIHRHVMKANAQIHEKVSRADIPQVGQNMPEGL